MTKDQYFAQGKEQQILPGQTTPQMRTATYNDEARPWNRNNHLLETNLLPSSDDSPNNFSRITSPQPELIITGATQPVTVQ
jgi:hypothetical protein